jgi:hypothetical protein
MSHDAQRDGGANQKTVRTGGFDPPCGTDVHIRNYEVQASHSVEVTVFADLDSVAFSERYHLRPGQSESVCDALPAGRYTVEIRCDGLQRNRAQCDVGGQPDQTTMIEVGNGAVSIMQGRY